MFKIENGSVPASSAIRGERMSVLEPSFDPKKVYTTEGSDSEGCHVFASIS
jgi:hypothetical protein